MKNGSLHISNYNQLILPWQIMTSSYVYIDITSKFVPKGPIDEIYPWFRLTHWGPVTHISAGKVTTIGSDNDLGPEWHQAIIWTSVWILIIGSLGTNFCEILIGSQRFLRRKYVWKYCVRNVVRFLSASMCKGPVPNRKQATVGTSKDLGLNNGLVYLVPNPNHPRLIVNRTLWIVHHTTAI